MSMYTDEQLQQLIPFMEKLAEYNPGSGYDLSKALMVEMLHLRDLLREVCDLPYGTTQSKRDTEIDLDLLWNQYLRVCKENAAIVLFAHNQFTFKLALSRFDLYRFMQHLRFTDTQKADFQWWLTNLSTFEILRDAENWLSKRVKYFVRLCMVEDRLEIIFYRKTLITRTAVLLGMM